MSHPKSRTRVVLEIVLATIVLGAVFIWSESLLSDRVGPDDAVGAGPVAMGPSALVERAEIPLNVEALGTLRPVRTAVLAARVMGSVERVTVEEGARVRRGDVLIQLSAPELGARSSLARGEVELAETRLGQARRDLRRTEALFARDAATAMELEQATTAEALAGTGVDTARQAAAGEQALASYRTLTAPIDGRVTARLVDPGDLATPGVALLRLEDDERYRLEVPLDERVAARVALGDIVPVVIDAIGLQARASVAEIAPLTDAATRTVVVKLELDARDELRTGQFGRARFAGGTRAALTVPERAVRRVGGLPTVRVLNADATLVMRHVRLGAELPAGRREILAGLAAGERVELWPSSSQVLHGDHR